MIRFTLILFFLIGALFAQEDEYHQALKAQLEQEFGITGGEWMIGETEKNTNSQVNLTRVNRKTSTWEGDEPFTQVLELTTTARQSNSWDAATRFTCTNPINNGDALLLIIWANSIESDQDVNHITFKFEPSGGPWNSDTQPLIRGADIKPGWRQWMIPFGSTYDYPAGNGRLQLDMGSMKGTIQIAGVALINYGDKYTEDELPFSTHHLDYTGRDPNAPWRTEALQRIEEIRKGNLSVKVVNQNGQAIKNAAVTVNMQQHEFGFGTAIATRWWFSGTSDARTYLSKLENLTGDGRTFSVVVFENALKWPAWENSWHTTKEQNVEVVDWLKSTGMRVRGHNLVWPKWNHLPDDIEANQDDKVYIENRIKNHIADCAGYDGIKGNIDEWDVINEMVHCTDLAEVFGTEDIYTDWMKWAAEADPNAKLYLNEYSIINGGGNDVSSQEKYKEIIQRVLDQGGPLHGLGVQGHMGSNLTPPAKILQIFDDFAQFGLDISVTEYDAEGTPGELGADYMRDILIACFSHPQVVNFLMWGFWDGAHWKQDAPIFNRDWTIKPSGEAFIQWVFDEWWTNESGATNRDGQYTTRAFYGNYDVTADFDGQSETVYTQFNRESGEITIQLNTTATSVESGSATPLEFELADNYPNPFNPGTTIRFAVPHRAQVELRVYDTQGRLVDMLQNGTLDAGWHQVEFNGRDLASGTYVVRMEAEGFSSVKKMLMVK